jgi:phosphatidylglycerophosphatase A
MALPTESQTPNNIPSGTSPATDSRVGFLTKAFASGLFSGFSPVASGTAGSAVGLAFYWIPGFEHALIMVPLGLLVFFLGVKAADTMEKHYGQDPGEVTIDEILGMWVSLLFLPKSLVVSVTAFFVFRILDIVKPFPARRFDSRPGGTGVMLDDVVSGVYTNLLLQLALVLHIF